MSIAVPAAGSLVPPQILPAPGSQSSGGARPTFTSPQMVQQWADEKTRWELRVALLLTTMIYSEQGAYRMRVLRLHDGPSPYCYGLAADISVLELPGVKRAALGLQYKLPTWVCERINLLLPFGDGRLNTATYDGAKITLQVPVGGYRKETNALSEWMSWGATGRILRPHRVKV